ncbi:MAG: hypothetical protein RIM99_20150 [Cyclobacteriaceae bacterium]
MTKLKILPLLILFCSCYENTPEPANKPYLIAGNSEFGKTWSISQIEVELGTLTPRPCVTDNFITYFPNGNYEINEGASKCTPNDPPAVVGSWSMNTEQTLVSVTIGDSIQNWVIESIDNNNHRITSQFREGERTYVLTVRN